MTSPFADLKKSLQITPLDNDHVQLSVSLPRNLLPLYLQLFESLTGFVRILHQKARQSHHETEPDSVRQESLDKRDRFYLVIVEAYDSYTSQGLTRTEAIKRISSDVRKDFPRWYSTDLIRSALIAAGRPGPRRKQP